MHTEYISKIERRKAMQKMVKGTCYDTDKAHELAHHIFMPDKNDPCWFEESLYETWTGSYFLHGFGGSDTEYGQPDGEGGYKDGENIFPLNEDDAKEWVLRNFNVKVFDEIFYYEEVR